TQQNTLATWATVWEVYLDPKWAQQRLRLYGAQDRALEQFFKKLEEEMAEVSLAQLALAPGRLGCWCRAAGLLQGGVQAQRHRPAAGQGGAGG
ncbi:hypothetical protein HaLaN_22071, partial [Haematococcus lacustris]